MGDTCGCCSKEQHNHEEHLLNSSRTTVHRRRRRLNDGYNDTDKCCCSGEPEPEPELKQEFAGLMEQLPQTTKAIERAVQTSPIHGEFTSAINADEEEKKKERKQPNNEDEEQQLQPQATEESGTSLDNEYEIDEDHDEDTKMSEEPIPIPTVPFTEGSPPATTSPQVSMLSTTPHVSHGSDHQHDREKEEEKEHPQQSSDEEQKEEVNRFDTVTQEQCLQRLTEMKAIVSQYVHKNALERWTVAHRAFKNRSFRISTDFREEYDAGKNSTNPDYKEMKSILLKNFEKVFNIKKNEMKDFKRMVLSAIAMCPEIYFLDLNSSSTDSEFLGQLLDVLMQRNRSMHETKQYGPEIVDIQNIPIDGKGMELICQYLEANIVHTKWVKIGHCFGYEIPSEWSEKVCIALEKNEYILKMNIEFQSKQHLQRVERRLKTNIENYKNNVNQKRKIDNLYL